jgi:hypothetical protein
MPYTGLPEIVDGFQGGKDVSADLGPGSTRTHTGRPLIGEYAALHLSEY